ncbi:TIGR02678 family protein [Desulfosporosinus sp. SB140]|uniref:TIGR02678 family protein n=1 Tax=Desulfosporosinus paludis TaxID=3115649 RepID=UPI00388FD025
MEKIKVGKLNSAKRRRTNIISEKELAERKRTCMKALLNRSWIAKEKDPQLYYWIKEQYVDIQDWFMHYTGYSLILNRKLAKLDKVPVVAFPWMGFQEFREPLDYAFFTYGLWFLENKTEGEQFLLTDLVKEIKEYMSEQGMGVDWKNYFQRLSMARALKKLKNLEIIQAVDGQEANWATHSEGYDVLYECSAYSRYILRNFPKDLTSYKRLEDMGEIAPAGNDPEEINRSRRYRLYRRFLLEPIVLDRQWQEDSFYFHGQKNYLIQQLKSMFGWEGSKYREGILFFEPEMTADSEVFPTLASISDLTMLVCGEIRHSLTNSELGIKAELDGSVRITKSEVERILLKLKADYGDFWINEYRKMKSSAPLADLVCEHLLEWGFGQWEDHVFFVLNAAGGRWQVQYGSVELDD